MAAANLRGALLVVVAMAAFCVNDAFIKDLSTRAPIGELMAVRGVFAVALMLVILPWLGLRIGWPERYTWLRAAGEVAVTFTFLAALARLPIGDTYTLYFAGPLLLTAGAALLLGEQVGPRRWAAVLVGFLGRPGRAGPAAGMAGRLPDRAPGRLPQRRPRPHHPLDPGRRRLRHRGGAHQRLRHPLRLGHRARRQLGPAGLARHRPVRARGLRRRRRLHRVRGGAAHRRALLRRHLPLCRHPHGHAAGPRRLGRRARPAHAGGCGADHGRGALHRLRERALAR